MFFEGTQVQQQLAWHSAADPSFSSWSKGGSAEPFDAADRAAALVVALDEADQARAEVAEVKEDEEFDRSELSLFEDADIIASIIEVLPQTDTAAARRIAKMLDDSGKSCVLDLRGEAEEPRYRNALMCHATCRVCFNPAVISCMEH